MLPSTLYKYLPPDRIDVLASLRMRFTQARDFNDPFEAYPRIGSVKEKSVRRRLQPGEDLDELMTRVTPYFQQVGPDMVFDEVSASFGALCLSTVVDDPLLWAHYADGHRGFAIGFDASHEWFHVCDPPNPPLDAIQQVAYAEDRPRVVIAENEDLSDEERRQNALAMMCTKHTSWKYEREWRLIRSLDVADQVVEGDVYLFNFPPDAVSQVVLGARMTGDLSARMRGLLSSGPLRSARIRRATRSYHSFRLEMVDVQSA